MPLTRSILIAAVVAALALVACSGPAPGLIGAFPQGQAEPIIIAEAPPAHEAPPYLSLTYDASLTIEVHDTHAALYNLDRIAARHSGYLLASRTWSKSGDVYAEATIAVPASEFQSAKAELRWLGTVLEESISGELDYDHPGWGGGGSFSNITVSLQPESASWGRKLWSFVSRSLITVFWLVVIVIPPALMIIGLGTVAGWVRDWARRRRPPTEPG